MRLWSWVRRSENLTDLATGAGLLAAAIGVAADLVGWALTVGGLAVILWALSWVARRYERKALVRRAREILKVATVDQVLYLTGRYLGLQGGGWRISLYRLSADAQCWSLVARSASTDRYLVCRDAWQVDVDSGVLRTCMLRSADPQGGFDQTPLFPSRTEDVGGWTRGHQAWGYGEEDVQRLTMPTRCYAGLSFKVNVNDGRGVTLGLVVETDYDAHALLQGIDQHLNRPYFEALAEFLLLRDQVSDINSDDSSMGIDLAWPRVGEIELALGQAADAIQYSQGDGRGYAFGVARR